MKIVFRSTQNFTDVGSARFVHPLILQITDRMTHDKSSRLEVNKLVRTISEILAGVKHAKVTILLPKMSSDMLSEAKIQNQFQHVCEDVDVVFV